MPCACTACNLESVSEVRNMSMLTVRDLDSDVVAKLKLRAALNGRSMEAEVRALLAQAVISEPEVSFVSAFADAFDGAHTEIPVFERSGELPRGIDW